MNKKNRTIKVLTDKEENKKAEEFLNDGYQEKWENGELGKDLKHAVMSRENMSGAPTTIRLPESLKNSVSSLAQDKGLTLNSYVRMLLKEHVSKNKSKIKTKNEMPSEKRKAS